MMAERKAPRITVITEVDRDGMDLGVTGESLLSQSFIDWEWSIVTSIEDVVAPFDDPRVSIVCGPSRARSLRGALSSSGDVALLEAGRVLQPTALEKWLWFLEAHPDRLSVQSHTPLGDPRAPRLIRRSAVDEAGSLDAAVSVARTAEGFALLPDARPSGFWGELTPRTFQSPNEWLPPEPVIHNHVESGGRRLLMIVPWMTVGGGDKVNLDLLDQLGALGWRVTVATTIDGPHELYAEYAKRTSDLFPLAHFLPLPYHPLFLRYLIESRRPDAVLVSNSELGYRLMPYLRGMCPGTPFVDFCHSEAEHWNKGGYPRFSIEYGQYLDLTMTASGHLKRWMVERGGDDERIEVCYANVDVHAFRPSPSARGELRARLGLPQEEPIVLFVGRVSEDKQPRVLAAALSRLRSRGLEFTAVVAGDGPDRSWLEAELAKNLEGRVRMLGSLESGEIASVMAGSDVLVAPSRSEGIALALYEAMASGMPVVGARVGGQAELVIDGCGLLVERSTPTDEAVRYADALEELLRDPARRAAMGAAARERVETTFALERLGERADELLGRAISLHATNPRPAPTVAMARSSASETIELVRLARLMDDIWELQFRGTGLRGLGIYVYGLLRRLARPAYLWGVRRGWSWLPRIRDTLLRLLAGETA